MSLLNKYVHTIIGECVESIRETGTITGITAGILGQQTITAVNTLAANEVVTINSVDYVVISATSSGFVITSALTFVEGMEYESCQPYYLHEKQKKANMMLASLDKGVTDRYKKYPLVLLMRPYTEDYSNPDNVTVSNVQIAIVGETNQEWNADERYLNNITPILDTIYNGLINAMADHDEIIENSIYQIEHRREDECLIDGNPLPDTLDGILLTFTLHLRRKNNCN